MSESYNYLIMATYLQECLTFLIRFIFYDQQIFVYFKSISISWN